MAQKLQHESHPLLCVEGGGDSPLIHSLVVRYSSTQLWPELQHHVAPAFSFV